MTERGHPALSDLVGQMPQDGDIDIILSKARSVLPETELPSQSAICCIAAPLRIYRGLTALSNQAKKSLFDRSASE